MFFEMLFKCNLLLIVLYIILLISKPGVVDAGSKLPQDLSTHGFLTSNLKPPILPFVPKIIQNAQAPLNHHQKKKHISVEERSLKYLKMINAIEDIKNSHGSMKYPKENETPFEELYGNFEYDLTSCRKYKVFAKKDSNNNVVKRYTVKVINNDELILKEFRIGYGLQHRNVIQIYDLMMNQDGQWCLVMEFVGIIPHSRLYGQYHGEKVHYILKQLIEGMWYLHSLGIAYGNIYGDNSGGEVKLFNFELSVKINENEKPFKPIEEPMYSMSTAPEALQRTINLFGGLFKYTYYPRVNIFQADVFSCGVHMYEISTGYSPFYGTDEKSEDFQGYKQDPEKWFNERETRPVNPLKVPDVVKRMMDPNPETRITLYELYVYYMLNSN